jgi:peptide deformylase
MLETMKVAHGVGLAAQQIGRALQVAVIDVSEVEDRPSTLELEGKPADVKSIMPLVLINPEVKPVGKTTVAAAEGCLSFPEIFSEIERPESVDVAAQNEKGKHIKFRCGGLLARAVQHEADHLNGILFIDRMERKKKDEFREELTVLQAETKAALQKEKKGAHSSK